MMLLLRRALLLLLLPLVLLAGCASGPPPPQVLTLTIKAGADQNPDPSGEGAPVAVRLYQLGAAGAFKAADVFALIDQEKVSLGADDLGSEQLLITPGTTQVVTRTLEPGTRFLGVAVLFREIDHATWRQLVPVAPSGPTQFTLVINGLIAKLMPG